MIFNNPKQSSSPHWHRDGNDCGVSTIMRQVLYALVPGVATLVYFFGIGVLVNIALVSIAALFCEAIALFLQKKPVWFNLKDNSALVSAVLLAIALPPHSPWWIALIGAIVAILIAKHVYGGLGYNPFNPAMVAYVFLLISFPLEMTQWFSIITPETTSNLYQEWRYAFIGVPDALTAATPLDVWRIEGSDLLSATQSQKIKLGAIGGLGWESVNIAFLVGGLYLLQKRIFNWHAPVGMLLGLTVPLLIYGNGDISLLLFHLFGGATMLGAFFIITDPVSSAVSNPSRLVYGIGAGFLLFIMRIWSNYPDAVAFAVLLMNFAAPLIDHYIQPRTYGHKQ